MAVNDPIGDLITRIRNAGMRKKSKLSAPNSRLRASVLEVLKSEGYIRDYATVEHKDGRNEVEIELKYFEGQPAIREIERVSKPGRRVYAGGQEMPRVLNGLGIAIVSTSKGVMTGAKAKRSQLGGEVIGHVW